MEILNKIPDWFPQRFLGNIQKELDTTGQIIMDWNITKVSMIATLNYIRSKGYKCEWIEKEEDHFLIKIEALKQ